MFYSSLHAVAAPPHEFSLQHYAFRLDDEHFDRAYEKIMGEGRGHWADPNGPEPTRSTMSTGDAASICWTPRVTFWS